MELKDLFTTIAQVSFALTGLVFLALTLNDTTREFWFSETNSAYVNLNLATLILPGIISLGGLIPQVPFLKIPSWVWMTLFIGLLYLYLAFRTAFITRNIRYKGFPKIEKQFGDVRFGLWIYSLHMILVSLGSIFLYAYETTSCSLFTIAIPSFVTSQQPTNNIPCLQLLESAIGLNLVIIVFTGMGTIYRFVRSYSEIKQSNELKTVEKVESNDAANFHAEIEPAANEKLSNSNILAIMLIGLIGLIAVLFHKSNEPRRNSK
jgi:hypothetical protein